MKKLIIFGTENYNKSIISLKNSASIFFDEILIFNTSHIDSDFFKKNHLILSQKRGVGYWLWKPYFINKTLQESDNGDIIFYVDAGNLFIDNPDVLYKKFDKNNGIILFDNRDGDSDGNYHINKSWVKRDSFILMNLDNEKHINNAHINASYQIYKKNDFSIKFVEEMLNFCVNPNIIMDTPNLYGDNYLGFKEHRHDQSILSLLSSKYDLQLDIDPSEWGNKCGLRDYPQIFFHHRNPKFELNK